MSEPQDLIREIIAGAFARPAMHGRPKEFESWVLALLCALEAVTTGKLESRVWWTSWRGECKALGLLEGQTLADRPEGAPDHVKADYQRISTALERVLEKVTSSAS